MFRIIANIIFVLAAGAIVWGLVKPGWEETLVLKKEKESLETAFANIKQIQELRNEKLSVFNSISASDKERFDRFLPPFEDEGALIVMLEDLIKSKGFFLKNISIQEKRDPSTSLILKGSPGGEYRKTFVSFTVSGSYGMLKILLESLGRSLRIVDVKNVSFNSDETDIYEYNIKGEVYWFTPKNKINVDKISDFGSKEVLDLLVTLKSLELKTDLLKDPLFNSLMDFYKKIDVSDDEVGRPNPFEPL